MSENEDNSETARITCDGSHVVDPQNSVGKGLADFILQSIKQPLINKINKKMGNKIDNQLDLPKLVGNMILKSLDKEDPVDNANAFAVTLGNALNEYVKTDTDLLVFPKQEAKAIPPSSKEVKGVEGGGRKGNIRRHNTCRKRRNKSKSWPPTRRQTCHR